MARGTAEMWERTHVASAAWRMMRLTAQAESCFVAALFPTSFPPEVRMATAVVEERELLKTISWFDGFVVAIANPSFLITGLGGSALSLGGWGAVILWTVSVLLGALHNYIYSETAAMFPKLSGGIAIYAHEAWKRYFSFIGPIAAFGYWIGWSVVFSATGVFGGFFWQYGVSP